MASNKPLPLMVDIFEPTTDIVPLLAQSLEVQITELNLNGFADYMWNAVDGHSIQIERKQAGELLSGLDRVEAQLRRQYDKAQENLLLIEGFIVPSSGGCQTITPAKDGKVFYLNREYKVNFGGFLDWLYQLDKCGITVLYPTNGIRGTARQIAALYWNSQKPEHSTLRRYIKQKIYIESQDQQVKNLMGLEGVSLGETRAKALIDKFGSLWGVVIRDEEELCSVEGIGKTLASQLLKAIGRPY
mgnify:CR=1 FL=1